MAEASTRVLLDRESIRLDGRPYFAYAARLLLSPVAGITAAMEELSAAGFTAVMTPPVNQRTLPTVETIFNEAERLGMLVILDSDPALAEPASFLANRFKHRQALHSYCLRIPEGNGAGFDGYIEQRDHLRAQDLFHPIWTPCPPDVPVDRWLATVDMCAARQRPGGPLPRQSTDNAFLFARALRDVQPDTPFARPFFCHSFQVGISDDIRALGVFDFDEGARAFGHDTSRWIGGGTPALARPRWDLMGPEPDVLRPRFYECLGARARGVVIDHYEALGGATPFTGRDRFCELAILAHEARILREFLAEGREVEAEAETDHPRLRSALIHHGEDVLVLIWRDAPGDEFWLDDTAMPHVEIRLRMHPETPVTAWRLDFPAGEQLDIDRRWKDSVRLKMGEVDLAAVALVTRGERRVQELRQAIADALPTALRYAMEGLEIRIAKARFIESELRALGEGASRLDIVDACERYLADTRALAANGQREAAWQQARVAMRRLRGIVNARMMEALGVTGVDPSSMTELLRRSFYTLPAFYRMVRTGSPREGYDFT